MKTSTKDQVEGTFHEIKGKAKEVAGKLSDNPNLEGEGLGEKVAGHRALQQLRRDTAPAKNRSGDQLREKENIERRIARVARGVGLAGAGAGRSKLAEPLVVRGLAAGLAADKLAIKDGLGNWLLVLGSCVKDVEASTVGAKSVPGSAAKTMNDAIIALAIRSLIPILVYSPIPKYPRSACRAGAFHSPAVRQRFARPKSS